jgi:hypothetical protein
MTEYNTPAFAGAEQKDTKTYFNLVSSIGAFAYGVDEHHPGATRREITDDKGNVTGVKYELQYKTMTGRITDVVKMEAEKDGRKWSNLLITLEKDGTEATLSMPWKGKFATSFFERMLAIDLEKEVEFKPFSFNKDGKDITGLTISQDGEKIESVYKETKQKKDGTWTTKYMNGYPERPSEQLSEDDWNIYVASVSKFLQSEFDTKFLMALDEVTTRVISKEEESANSAVEDTDVPF